MPRRGLAVLLAGAALTYLARLLLEPLPRPPAPLARVAAAPRGSSPKALGSIQGVTEGAGSIDKLGLTTEPPRLRGTGAPLAPAGRPAGDAREVSRPPMRPEDWERERWPRERVWRAAASAFAALLAILYVLRATTIVDRPPRRPQDEP